MWKRADRQKRLSKNSQLVLDVLEQSNKLCSAQEIHSWLRANAPEDAPGLTTIYRAIDSLMRQDLVQAVDIGDGERRYEKIEPGEHHHHLICTKCMASVHLEQCFVDALTEKVHEHHGFIIRSHVLEIFGLCEDCRSAGKNPQALAVLN